MENKHSTEPKRRKMQRSLSYSAKRQHMKDGIGLVTAKCKDDEVDGKRSIATAPQHHDDKTPDVIAKNKNRSLHNKLKRYLL